MSTKHTPGPWMLVETPDESVISSWDIHVGEYKVSVFPYKRIYSEDRTHSGLIIDKERMADARLIAAAPELLDALNRLLPMAEDGTFQYGANPDEDEDIIYARAAIAKATGEQL